MSEEREFRDLVIHLYDTLDPQSEFMHRLQLETQDCIASAIFNARRQIRRESLGTKVLMGAALAVVMMFIALYNKY